MEALLAQLQELLKQDKLQVERYNWDTGENLVFEVDEVRIEDGKIVIHSTNY